MISRELAGASLEPIILSLLAKSESYGYAFLQRIEDLYWVKLKRRRQGRNELSWRFSMLKNYLKIAFRNLHRHNGYAFINIGGLAIGLACNREIIYLLFQTDFGK
jgi:hypothetical protein